MKIGRVLAALPLLAISHAAWAQQVQVTVGVPPPPPPPNVTIVAPPPPEYVAPPPPPYYGPRRVVVMEPPPDLDRPRLRVAFGATGGPYIGDNFGGAGGLWGQLGVQINHLIAVYYQTHAMLGVVGSRTGSPACNGSSDCAFFGGIWLNEVMVDFTLGHVFQVGVGPAFDVFSVNSVSDGFLGFDARVGVALGRIGPWRRSGFMLGVDVHPTFNTDQANFPGSPVMTSILLTLGGGWW